MAPSGTSPASSCSAGPASSSTTSLTRARCKRFRTCSAGGSTCSWLRWRPRYRRSRRARYGCWPSPPCSAHRPCPMCRPSPSPATRGSTPTPGPAFWWRRRRRSPSSSGSMPRSRKCWTRPTSARGSRRAARRSRPARRRSSRCSRPTPRSGAASSRKRASRSSKSAIMAAETSAFRDFQTDLLPADFHPILRRWWEERFSEGAGDDRHVLPPTEAQLDGWQAIRRGEPTLIAAPTGSGKTLAAFLTSIDQLLREGLEHGELPDEVRVIYVSPLKALSADIHKNLAEPRREIRRLAEEMGYPPVKVTAAVRSGDTPQAERAAMLRAPPHILVTTPESLYLLLTAQRSRDMLKTARVVIVDEIHAVVQSRRGAHLALSLERLEHVCGRRLQRIGLSATQKPIEEVARFLVGSGGAPSSHRAVSIVDRGHRREIDLAIEVPGSPLEAVMSTEIWQENYNRLVALIESHRTTLIMVNTRRLAERMAHQLSERLGAEKVAAHHGSLAREVRLDAEERLRAGQLRVLVATASLELGIDIGHVDLVCQVSSPHRIATLLQRVGRSGHSIDGTPKGRIFPLTRDDLIECAAMARAVRDGELDQVAVPDQPLDVLAQQIVAEAGAEEWDEDALYDLFVRAYPYRGL